MKAIKVIFILYFFVIPIACSQVKAPEDTTFRKAQTISSLDGETQFFYYYKSTSKQKMPLVVSLHQWSSDYKNFKSPLAGIVKDNNWNYIYPDFRGANRHIKACGSEFVIQDIDDAINWALQNLPVDPDQIYLVGASGGGYAGLCAFMKSKHTIKDFSIWVPITDLTQWYRETAVRGQKYANDIVNCTGIKPDENDFAAARERSPLHWETPVRKLNSTRLRIYAGIHDGHTGAVSISHSLLFYNKIVANAGGGEKNMVSSDDIIWMLTTRSSPDGIQGKIGERNILYSKSYGNVSITIFEGGHEMLHKEALP